MSVDYRALLYDPVYSAIGVAASLVDNDGAVFPGLTVIDKTAGVEVDIGGDVAVNTIKPACCVRSYELTSAGVSIAGLRGSQLTFNGKTWLVENKMPRPSPAGEGEGEIMLLLTEAGE